MRTKLLLSVAAAALSFSIGGALAQSSPMSQGAAGGSAAPSMRSEKSTPGMAGESKAIPAEHRSASEKPSPATPADMKAEKAESKPAAGDKAMPRADAAKPGESKADMKRASEAKPAADKPATGRSAAKDKMDDGTKDAAAPGKAKDGAKNANGDQPPAAGETRSRADTGRADRNEAKATPPATLDTEKQERLRTALSSTKVENITNVNFNVNVGTRVPSSVRFHPLPSTIVEIVPQYRGYEYIVVRDEIVIVEPRTRKIVYTLNEGRSAGMNRPAVDCK